MSGNRNTAPKAGQWSIANPFSQHIALPFDPLPSSENAATGTVTGRVRQPGAYEFTITASSNGGCAGSRVYSFSISNVCTTITLPDLPGGTVGQLYSQSLAVSPGGVYSYTVSGNPPPGGQFYDAAGLLFGYPTTPGVYGFSINAKDGNNCTGGRKYLLTITKAN